MSCRRAHNFKAKAGFPFVARPPFAQGPYFFILCATKLFSIFFAEFSCFFRGVLISRAQYYGIR